MSTEIFFLYDTHCPWSYATLPLVKSIAESFPEMPIHLWHTGRYEGDENIAKKTLEQVHDDSGINFSTPYLDNLSQAKDSTMSANIMAWLTQKVPDIALDVLTQLFHEHFEAGNELTSIESLDDIVSQFKLSPPRKVFTRDKFTKDAEMILHYINEIQEVIGTPAIPALLIAVDDKLVLLNHNLYLNNPKAIIEAVNLELNS